MFLRERCNKTLGELKEYSPEGVPDAVERCNKTLGELKGLELQFENPIELSCNKTLGELKESRTLLSHRGS